MADDVVRTSSRHGWMAATIRSLQREQLLKILGGHVRAVMRLEDLQELLFDLLDEARIEPLDVLRALRERGIPR